MATPYFLFPAILVPVLIINTKCHTTNNSDVIVINSGHAEVIDQRQILNEPSTTLTTENIKIITQTITTEPETEATEDVVFVPNEREVQRNFDESKMKIGDILYKKTVGDILNDQSVRIETEAPNEDILFISGKNNENVELPKIQRTKEAKPQPDTPKKKINFDCTNLDCNNTVKSICGVKKDDGRLKYRLFLNDCYFRKVNCNFKHEENRYKKIELERCKHIASRNTERLFSFNPMPLPPGPQPKNFRRSSSRRSQSMSIDGKFCSHACPISCPNDYDPECAVSASGQRRVFINHCEMDLNSCVNSVVWHKRPLSECVGGKKADMRQNRGFINWMQRVGIVDKKGRLVLT